ncbi:MAG TPA: Sec-independent protein translocase subunit TatB [Epsilonproteobacteria bacterium]|nr:Sec-independent protein translocase subunit TatB [Campylobacterota bacterium]
MFGIGFTELLLIAVIAILFLGPDKLPGALVEMAKFIKSVKKTIGDAKSSLEEEMKIADLKEEALNYKKQLDDATNELKNFKNIDFNDEIDYESGSSADFPTEQITQKQDAYAEAPRKVIQETEKESSTSQVEPKNETVTFKKKTKISAKNKEKKDDKKSDA